MVTSVRRYVTVDFLIWIKNVIIDMESVTVNLDLPANSAIKVSN